jgi:hypothetical protein
MDEELKEQFEVSQNPALEQHIIEWQLKSTKFHLENKEMIKRKPMPKITAKGMGKPCPTCGKIMSRVKGPSRLSLEHIVPRSTGGDNSYDGIFPQCIAMCYLCNQTRNKVVLALGVDKVGTEKRVTPEAIRFLITQVYGVKEDLDRQMLKLFLERSALVRSRAEREKTISSEKVDTSRVIEETTSSLVAPSKQRWWNPRTWFKKPSPLQSREISSPSHLKSEVSQESSSVKRIQSIYLNLTKEETLVQFETDLIEAIANENYSGKLFHSTSLLPLYSAYGGGLKLREKLGMKDKNIDELLIHYFPTRFIVQNAGLNKIIHILDSTEDDYFEDDYDYEPIEEHDMQEHVSEEIEVEETPAPPVSMNVRFVRENIDVLLEQTSTEENRINCSHIRDAMAQLRDDDGTDWDSFFDDFDIHSDGTTDEKIELLLSLIGFKFIRIEVDAVAHLQFSLPHDF